MIYHFYQHFEIISSNDEDEVTSVFKSNIRVKSVLTSYDDGFITVRVLLQFCSFCNMKVITYNVLFGK